MGSDVISKAHVCQFAKDSSKKKRGNRLTKKQRQNKLDARREQCMPQGAKKEYKVVRNDPGCPNSPAVLKSIKGHKVQANLPSRVTREKPEILATCDGEAVTLIRTSIGRKSGHNHLSSKVYSSRSSCSGSCSSSCSEEDRDEGCLDDWEAVADALSEENGQPLELEHRSEPEQFISRDGSRLVHKTHQGNRRAWSPDDTFRPRSLPHISKQHNLTHNLPRISKQHNLTHNSGRSFSQRPARFSWQSIRVPKQQPSVCPICCEDFDVTDSSFLPCPCGFRLCLFCHKRILEVDGRCPGCRKHYGSVNASAGYPGADLASQTTHPCSKDTRF